MTTTQSTFTARNGDTLSYLTALKTDVDKRLATVQEKRRNVDEVLKEMVRSESRLIQEQFNIRDRLQAWWLEYREMK